MQYLPLEEKGGRERGVEKREDMTLKLASLFFPENKKRGKKGEKKRGRRDGSRFLPCAGGKGRRRQEKERNTTGGGGPQRDPSTERREKRGGGRKVHGFLYIIEKRSKAGRRGIPQPSSSTQRTPTAKREEE